MTVREFEVVTRAIEAAWSRDERKLSACIDELQSLLHRGEVSEYRKSKET